MRIAITLILAILAILAAPAAAVRLGTELGLVVVNEEGYVAYFDGADGNPDPADGFVSVGGASAACVGEAGSPGDASWSQPPTCVDGSGPPNPPPGPFGVCFQHNDAALTNLCVVATTSALTAETPAIGAPPVAVCIVGDQCVDRPAAEVVPATTVPVPVVSVGGYVEATVACRLRVPCGVVLP